MVNDPNPHMLTFDNSARSHEAVAWAHQEGELHQSEACNLLARGSYSAQPLCHELLLRPFPLMLRPFPLIDIFSISTPKAIQLAQLMTGM